jgi:polysaccharide export outer membrane protein
MVRALVGFCLVVSPLWGQLRPGVVDTTVAGVANLPAQKIQPDDLIAVSVYGEPELTRTVRVGEDGSIGLPMLDQRIAAGGLMPAKLEAAIAQALREGEILINPMVTVTILEYSTSRTVSVIGAVRKPLTFPVIGTVRLLDALAKAEGLNTDAGPELLVTRPGADFSERILLKDLIDGADSKLNIVLEGGEGIRVPEARKIYVLGNVKKPGAFPVRDGSENTVLKLLAMVEGVTPYSAKQAFIYRSAGDGQPREEIPLDLKKIMARKAPDVAVNADDILYIPDATGRRLALAALEKVALYGSGAAAAVIYAGSR